MKPTIIVYNSQSKANSALARRVAEALGLKKGSENIGIAMYGENAYSRWDTYGYASNGRYPADIPFSNKNDHVIDLRPYDEKQVQLNSEYTAVIEGDEVVVGCQRIPKAKVLELAAMLKG